MTTLNQYRVPCTTDSKDEYVWAETAPTVCPTNTAHTIDSGNIVIVDTQADNEVVIKEEETKTGGHYQAQSFSADVPASTGWSDLLSVSFPIPVNILSATCKCRSSSDKDEVEFLIGQDTTIGAITADVAASATVIDVQQSVIDNIEVGRWVSLTDGTNTDDCGRVLSIDTDNLKITVETATTNSFAAATPTYVKMTVKMAPKIELTDGHLITLGESKIGGSYVPANTTMKLRYNSLDGASGKRFSIILEYLY
jgi:hypothetical protein